MAWQCDIVLELWSLLCHHQGTRASYSLGHFHWKVDFATKDLQSQEVPQLHLEESGITRSDETFHIFNHFLLDLTDRFYVSAHASAHKRRTLGTNVFTTFWHLLLSSTKQSQRNTESSFKIFRTVSHIKKTSLQGLFDTSNWYISFIPFTLTF